MFLPWTAEGATVAKKIEIKITIAPLTLIGMLRQLKTGTTRKKAEELKKDIGAFLTQSKAV